MATKTKGSSKKTKNKGPKGLAPKSFKGFTPSRFNKGGGGGGGNQSWKKRVRIKKGQTVPMQFCTTPDEFEEGECHIFRENGMWKFIPCADEGCPLCGSDDPEQARTSYRFWANVYNHETKKVEILEGGGNLAIHVHQKYNRKPSVFCSRVFDLTMFPTKPVSFSLERAEEEALKGSRLAKLEQHDLIQYMVDEMQAYYGDDLENPKMGRTSLDEDDDEDDDDDEDYTLEDLMDMTPKEVRVIAKEYSVKLKDKDGDKRTQRQLARLIVKKQQ